MEWTWRQKNKTTSRRRIKAGKQNKTDDLCPFGRVSAQEILYIHFHTGHIISSLACGSHISTLVNSGANHLAFWQKIIHLHLPLFTMPWAGKKHWHLMWNVQKKFGGFAIYLSALPRQTTMEKNTRHMSTPGEESFTRWNKWNVSWLRLQTHPHLPFLPAIPKSCWRQ